MVMMMMMVNDAALYIICVALYCIINDLSAHDLSNLSASAKMQSFPLIFLFIIWFICKKCQTCFF